MTVQSAPSELDSAPTWFTEAIADAPEHVDIAIRGANVHARVWGDRSLPGLMLLHGGSAHSGWWDHVAPQLARANRVVAVDLSGHGDSEWRESYSMSLWADEVMTVATELIDGPPVLIAHSMGGGVALAAAAEHPDSVAGLIVIDTALDPRRLERDGMRPALRPPRIHETFEGAVARFRTIPEQDVVLPYVGKHVAEQSLKQVEGGWTWKYDPNFFGQTPGKSMSDMLNALKCPTVCFRAEFGLVTPQMAQELQGLVGHKIPFVELPKAGHHPMLDQPLALIAGISTALELWIRPRR
ncbi:MAG: alpha/beta hydrolase [Actinomycetota bacterium]|nr:alpha/beta hydrolase [Actinomycetota bacterium]